MPASNEATRGFDIGCRGYRGKHYVFIRDFGEVGPYGRGGVQRCPKKKRG